MHISFDLSARAAFLISYKFKSYNKLPDEDIGR